MEALRTPDERFKNLVGYEYEANYLNIAADLRMHYIDVGPKDAQETLLLLHGEPSWSYLYRKMIPTLTDSEYRCIAPDLIGFGKSDKPTSVNDYTYANHIQWTAELFRILDVSNVTLFAQDWGGLIGLRLVPLFSDRFARICISNTGLPTGDQKPNEAFLKWQAFSQKVESFPFEMVMQGATETELSTEELKAYRAPFPDESYTAGARIFPALVPTTPDDPESDNNRKLWKEFYAKWDKPFLTLFGDKDPVTKGGEAYWQKIVPGAKNQNHKIIKGGGHFIQEDKGPELANLLVDLINTNPS